MEQQKLGTSRQFWCLLATGFLNRIGTFVVPFLTLYLTKVRDLPLSSAAAIVSAVGIGSLGGGMIGGIWSDRFGAKRVMLASLLCSALTTLAMPSWSTSKEIVVLGILFGFFSDLYRPAAGSAIACTVEPTLRARAFGYVFWAVNLGGAVGAFVGGFIAQSNFDFLFYADAASSFAAAATVGLFLKSSPLPRAEKRRENGLSRSRRLVQVFLMARYLVVVFMLASLGVQLQVTFPVAMRNSGLTVRDYGIVMGVGGTAIIILSIPVSRCINKLRRNIALTTAASLCAIGFFELWILRGLISYTAAVLTITLGQIVFAPVGPSVMSDFAEPAQQGLMQSLYAIPFGAAMTVGPAVGGFFMARFGPNLFWLGCSSLAIATSVGFLIFGRTPNPVSSAAA